MRKEFNIMLSMDNEYPISKTVLLMAKQFSGQMFPTCKFKRYWKVICDIYLIHMMFVTISVFHFQTPTYSWTSSHSVPRHIFHSVLVLESFLHWHMQGPTVYTEVFNVKIEDILGFSFTQKSKRAYLKFWTCLISVLLV